MYPCEKDMRIRGFGFNTLFAGFSCKDLEAEQNNRLIIGSKVCMFFL